MNENGYIKVFGAAMLFLMFAILLLVGYNVLKPPIVNKETIDTLVNTAKSTESYVKELREMAYQNRLETNEDNDLLRHRGSDSGKTYKDLYEKYGPQVGVGSDIKSVPLIGSNVIIPDGLQFQAKSNGRQQLSHNPN